MATKRQKKKKANSPNRCVLCGEMLPRDIERRAIGRTGRGICAACIEISGRLVSFEKPDVKVWGDIIPPVRLIELLDEVIIGQNKAKRAVAVSLWKQQLRSKGEKLPNSPLLLYGPTGCGKTALASQAAKLCDLPFMMFDATNLTETGYRGMDASDMVKAMAERYGKQKAATGVIFVDEVDKLAAKGSDNRRSYCRGTQHTLLKLIEGIEIDGVSTEHMLFIFSGAFHGLSQQPQASKQPIGFEREKDDEETIETDIEVFIKFGMEPELMGRIQRWAEKNEMLRAKRWLYAALEYLGEKCNDGDFTFAGLKKLLDLGEIQRFIMFENAEPKDVYLDICNDDNAPEPLSIIERVYLNLVRESVCAERKRKLAELRKYITEK